MTGRVVAGLRWRNQGAIAKRWYRMFALVHGMTGKKIAVATEA